MREWRNKMKKGYSRSEKMRCVVVGKEEKPGTRLLVAFAREIGATTLRPKKKAKGNQTERFCVRFPWSQKCRLFERGNLRNLFHAANWSFLLKLSRL